MIKKQIPLNITALEPKQMICDAGGSQEEED